MIKNRITLKVDMSPNERLEASETVMNELIQNITPVIHALPGVNLRATQSIADIYTYVDDTLSTSIREDISWLLLGIYTCLAA